MDKVNRKKAYCIRRDALLRIAESHGIESAKDAYAFFMDRTQGKADSMPCNRGRFYDIWTKQNVSCHRRTITILAKHLECLPEDIAVISQSHGDKVASTDEHFDSLGSTMKVDRSFFSLIGRKSSRKEFKLLIGFSLFVALLLLLWGLSLPSSNEDRSLATGERNNSPTQTPSSVASEEDLDAKKKSHLASDFAGSEWIGSVRMGGSLYRDWRLLLNSDGSSKTSRTVSSLGLDMKSSMPGTWVLEDNTITIQSAVVKPQEQSIVSQTDQYEIIAENQLRELRYDFLLTRVAENVNE